MTEDTDPYFHYVLMRNDLPDYLSGKAMAQANHAGTKFMDDMRKHNGVLELAPRWYIPFQGWLSQGGGFGTTIVLSVHYRQMRGLVEVGEARGDIITSIVHDPTYPVRDGDRINHMPVDTCAYVFGRKLDCFSFLGDLPLFKEPD